MKVGDSDVAKWLSRSEKLVTKTNAIKSILIERRRSIVAEMGTAADESVIESLLLERDSITEKIEELTRLEAHLAPQLEEAIELTKQCRNNIEEHDKKRPSNDAVKEYENATRELDDKEKNLSRLTTQIEASTFRYEKILLRIAALTQDNLDAKDVVDVETIELNNYLAEYDLLENEMNHVRIELEDSEKEKILRQEESAQLSAQAKVLKETFDISNTNSGIENVREKQGVKGTLLENITIDERVQEAASSIIGSIAGSIVVESKQNVESTIEELLLKNSSAQIMMLESNIESHNENSPAGTIPLIDFISSKDENVLSILGKYLSNIVFCDGNWKTALQIAVNNPRFIIVTNSGDRFGSDMPWKLGKTKTVTVTKEKVEKAIEQALQAKEELIESENEYSKNYEKSQELINAISACNASLNECRTRLNIATKTFETTTSAISSRRSEVDSLETEISSTKEVKKFETREVDELKVKLIDLQYQKENSKALFDEFHETEKSHEIELSKVNQNLREIENQMQSSTVMLADLESRLRMINERLAKDPIKEQEANLRREKSLNALEKIDKLYSRAEHIESQAKKTLEILTEERNLQTQKAHESTFKLEELRNNRRTLEKSVLEIRELSL